MNIRAARHFARVSGSLLCLIGAALPARGASPDRYAISSMTSAVAPSQKIGKIKQGFICAPKGSLKFGDLQRVDEDALRRRIAALSGQSGSGQSGSGQSGFVIDQTDNRFPSAAPPPTHMLVGSLDRISLDLCVPGANIGIGSRKSKGSGTLVVTWEVWRQADKSRTAQRTIEIPILVAGADPRQSSEVLEEQLALSAVQFLKATSGSSGQ